MNPNKRLIEIFIEGKLPYKEAVSLFLELSGKKVVSAKLLEIGENVSNHQYLLNYFNAFVWKDEPEAEPEVVEAPTVRNYRSVETAPTPTAEPSSEFQSLKLRFYEDWKAAYRKRGHLHGRLHAVVSDEMRYKVAAEIIALQKEIDRLNLDKIEFENGTIPTRYIKNTATAEEFIRLRNLKQYIAREKKKLTRNNTPEEIQNINERIARFEKEMHGL